MLVNYKIILRCAVSKYNKNSLSLLQYILIYDLNELISYNYLL